MVSGDLVIVFAQERSATSTVAISEAGGQTWTSGTSLGISTQTSRIFWAIFDGTWDANPSVSFTGGVAQTVVMHVFRPTAGFAWSSTPDTAEATNSGAAPADPFDVTITGFTPTAARTVSLFLFSSTDDNTWAIQTGQTNAGNAQYRNNPAGSDQSNSAAYIIQTTASATGNVTNRQTANGGDAWHTHSIAFAETSTCSGTPTITDVDTDETVTATQANVVITGTGFCAPQGGGSVTLRQSGNSKTLSVDTWSDTSIQADMSGVGMGVTNGLQYGSMDIRVTNDAANSDDQAITVTVPSGTISANLSGGLVTLAFDSDFNPSRPVGDPVDLLAASQLALNNGAGCTLATDVTINADASLDVDENCTSFDYDFTGTHGSGGSHLYHGSAGTIEWAGLPPHFGGIDIPDHVLAVGLAMTGYDVDDYFVAGDAAFSARALRQQTSPTDSTTDVNGAVTNATTLVVDDASVLLDDRGKYIRCATGDPVQVGAVNPLTNEVLLRSPITCADNAQVDVYTDGAGSVSQVTVNSGTGAVSGTPDTDATTTELVYRMTDADGLTADVRIPFQIDVVTIPDVTGDDRATGTTTLEGLGIVVDFAYTCSIAEAFDEILTQQESSVLFGTEVDLSVVGGCTRAYHKRLGLGLGL